MSKKTKYPLPWIATGCGSYRRLSKDKWELYWRPNGHNGIQKRLRVSWSEAEILGLFSREAANRKRRKAGLTEQAGWLESMDEYESRLKARQRKPKYILAVMALLKSLQESSKLELSDVQARDVSKWLDGLAVAGQQAKKPGWARTVNKKRAMIAGFFSNLHNRGQIACNPVKGSDPYKQTKKIPRRITPEEYGAVWAVSEPEIRDLLDWLLITGTRFNETASAKRRDISGGLWAICNRKGKNDHELPIPPLLENIVLRQKPQIDGLIFHKWTVPSLSESGKIPANRHKLKTGDPVESFWFRRVLKFRCEAANIQPFSAHDLRRAAARWSRDAGHSLQWIQSLLGHASAKTTELYTGTDAKPATKRLQDMLISRRDQGIQSATQ